MCPSKINLPGQLTELFGYSLDRTFLSEFMEEDVNFTVYTLQKKTCAAASAFIQGDITVLWFKAAKGKLCSAFSSFCREYGDKSSPPTLAPLVTDSAAKDSAGDQEELQGKEPGSSCSPEPEQPVDIRDLSLKDRDACAELLGKEELHEDRAAEPAEDASTEEQQEAEDSRTPQGVHGSQ